MSREMADHDGRVVNDPHAGAQRPMCPFVVLSRGREGRMLVEPADPIEQPNRESHVGREQHVTVEQWAGVDGSAGSSWS